VPQPEIRTVTVPADWDTFRALAVEYAEDLGENLCFQDFDRELAHAEDFYGGPDGVAYLAFLDGTPVGCVGVHRHSDTDAEMKRMYVRPSARGHGLGNTLTDRAIEFARARGYRRLILDTLSRLEVALHIYEQRGFHTIDAYRDNPLDGVRYLGLDLA
jgi:GNAT superfamily N-acetyltransferase